MGDRRKGLFIVLVGPDGVGKTEVAREFVHRRNARYFHFRPPLRASDLLDSPAAESAPKVATSGPFPLGPVRLVRNVFLFWLGYLGSVRPTLQSGADVVGDRWAYGYMVQPAALKYSGPVWLVRFALRVMPSPDLVVNLAAAPETVRSRKPELSIDEIERELKEWALLPVRRHVTIDAEPEVAVIVEQMVREALA